MESLAKRQLEDIVCWLVINSLDTECKQFNFLMQQDLANLYRRHSLSQLLTMFLQDGFEVADEGIRAHLVSFRESLNLDVADGLRVPRSFDENLRTMRDDHRDCIVGPNSEGQLNRIFEKVASMHFASEDGGLAQEQEQEQEEEKEQESAEGPDDQPVIFSVTRYVAIQPSSDRRRYADPIWVQAGHTHMLELLASTIGLGLRTHRRAAAVVASRDPCRRNRCRRSLLLQLLSPSRLATRAA